MRFNVKEINSEYNFVITGMSYIGNPKDGTCMFVTRKISKLIANLKNRKNCLVFVDKTIMVPEELKTENCFVFSDNPQADYGAFSVKMRKNENIEGQNRCYTLAGGGYYLGENVKVGKNTLIEPGCLIDHDVVIGDDAYIGFGSVIRNAIIGDCFSCYEHVVIGTESFNLSNAEGFSYRVPSFGKVYIGNHVDIGANSVIERGFNSDTIIQDNTKIDSGVNIGHDTILQKNTEITCGACVAGRVTVGSDVHIGMNSTIRQRVNIGENAMIGMGSSVIGNVKPELTVFGNPAKKYGAF